jgi:alcohol dehydrogenase class IV
MEGISEIAKVAHTVLLVAGTGNAPAQKMVSDLNATGLAVTVFAVSHEPTIELVESGIALARSLKPEIVIGFGGGSALDTAKAVAALSTNPDPIGEYLEVIGSGKGLLQAGLPMVAFPTTAGTGTEVTRNAVIACPQQRVKVSLRSPFLLARLAVVDPDLTLSVPQAVTAATGMDALAQVLEPFTSNRANSLVDGFCREGLRRVARSLKRVYRDGADRTGREDMSYASLMGGLSLANGGLGGVHGFAAPLGGMYNAPHGALCARLLAPVVRANIRAMEAREPLHPALAKYEEAARIVMGDAGSNQMTLAVWLEEMADDLGIPRLADLGVSVQAFAEIAEKAATASSMQANPIRLERDDLMGILAEAL